MDSMFNDLIEPISMAIQPVAGPPGIRRSNLLVVIEDEPSLSHQLGPICDFLGIGIQAIPSAEHLGLVLDEYRPLAVIAPFESVYQDGGHVLKSVAIHDATLPVMILTDRNATYIGAVDAMVGLLNLTSVQTPNGDPGMGELVDFLARAGQHARCRRITRVNRD